MSCKATIINLTEESQDPFEFLLAVTRRGSDAVTYSGPLGTTYLLNHPNYIRAFLQSEQFQRTSLVKLVLGEGLLASDGAWWKKQRKLALPFFHRNELPRFGPIIQAHTRDMLQRWTAFADSGSSVDVAAEMTRLTLSIIVEGLFQTNLGPKIDDLCDALMVILEDLGRIGCTRLNTPLTFSPATQKRFQAALGTLDQITEEIIAGRRDGPDDPDNLLSFLSNVRDQETGEKLTDRQIRDEVVTLMISGHETTSLILSWAWSLLAQHPEAESRLHDELDEVLGERSSTIEDLDKLPYTLMVLYESMRLYPPVWFIARKSVYSGEIAGVHIAEDSLVIISPYAIHRHPEFWDKPDEFDPMRFSDGLPQPKYAYIPFGGGRHLCLGMNLALLEGHLILATIAQKFRVHPLTDKLVVPAAAITLRQKDGLTAHLEARAESRTAVNFV